MKHCLVNLSQVYSNGGPWVQNGPAAGSWVRKSTGILKNVLLKNCQAQVLEIWYVALASGLPSLSNGGRRV